MFGATEKFTTPEPILNVGLVIVIQVSVVSGIQEHEGKDALIVNEPEPPPGDVAARIGHVTLAAKGNVAFADPTHPRETRLLAGHGSLSPDEMLVPLLAGRGRRA